MFVGAVAGQVDKHQVFGAGALGQGLHGTAQAFAGRHRAVGDMVAVVDQADLPAGAETAGQQVADIVGLAQEHALLAVAGHHQGVQLDRRGGRRHGGEGAIEQAALGQYPDLQGIGQQLAVGIAYAQAIGPGPGLHRAIGEHQGALPVIAVVVEATDVEAAIAEVQTPFTGKAPVTELPDVMAAVHAGQFAFAAEGAFAEFAGPHIAVGVFVAALAVELVLLEVADVHVAFGTVEGAVAFQLAIDEVTAELVAAVVVALAFTVGFAVGEQSLVLTAIRQLQATEAGILVVLEFAAIGHLPLFEGAFAVAPALLEAADVGVGRRGQGALAIEQALLELPFIDLAVAAVPFALAMPLALVELPGVPTAVGVVHPALALQQPIDHIPAITPAVRQPCVGRQQGFAVAASGEQQGQSKGNDWAHSGIRIIERRVCRSGGSYT